jgi:methionine synthase I (cobalamin-dependent)
MPPSPFLPLLDASPRPLLGDNPAQVARALHASGAEVIGINCSGGPAQRMRPPGGCRR